MKAVPSDGGQRFVEDHTRHGCAVGEGARIQELESFGEGDCFQRGAKLKRAVANCSEVIVENDGDERRTISECIPFNVSELCVLERDLLLGRAVAKRVDVNRFQIFVERDVLKRFALVESFSADTLEVDGKGDRLQPCTTLEYTLTDRQHLRVKYIGFQKRRHGKSKPRNARLFVATREIDVEEAIDSGERVTVFQTEDSMIRVSHHEIDRAIRVLFQLQKLRHLLEDFLLIFTVAVK